ncbi:hypothetical protein BG621_01840 [Parasaccharibacter apium]|nr:hypothetical protein BG621_01840 [Parasaccharibacter apium]
MTDNNPRPVVAVGDYQINFATLRLDSNGFGTLSNQHYNVQATFTTHTSTGPSDLKVQDFTFTDTKGNVIKGSYDYSWGNKAINGFIIGDGSGGYYVITSAILGSSSSTISGDQPINPSMTQYNYPYPFGNIPGDWATANFFFLNLNGTVYALRQDNSGTATDGQIANPSTHADNQFTFDTCFLAGSLIETPDGYKKIETLKAGDIVLTYDPQNNRKSPQPIQWVGQSTAKITPNTQLEMAGYPVKISKNAISEGVPHQDLLITPEHCIFINGNFIPVRMLVNGQSIFFDTATDKKEYPIYHIEMQKHSIICANGLLSESYLDTGNRHTFTNLNDPTDVISLHNTKQLSWEKDAAAPLCTDQNIVEPLHHEILTRAQKLKMPVQHPYKEEQLTDDPAFTIMTDDGTILHQQRVVNGYAIFSVPSHATQVTLLSNVSRPCDVKGPFVDDRRQLGVLIGHITYFHSGQSHDISTHLTTPDLQGWNTLEENTGLRWTKGAAKLPLPVQNHSNEAGLLAIQVVTGGPYAAPKPFLFSQKVA